MSKKKNRVRVKPGANNQMTNNVVNVPQKPAPTPPARFKVATNTLTRGVTRITDTQNANKPPKEPVVYYTPEVYQQMTYLVQQCTMEVGWMALVKNPADGVYLIHRIFVPDQEVTSVETDISGDALIDLTMELLDLDEDPNELYAWYHSHVNMSVSPSQQDENQVAEFLTTCDTFIRGIINKRGEYKVDVYYPKHGIAYNNVTAQVFHPPLDQSATDHLDALIKSNVRRAAPVHAKWKGGHYLGEHAPANRFRYLHDDPDMPHDNLRKTTLLEDYDAEEVEMRGKHFRRGSGGQTLSPGASGTGYGIDWDESTPVTERPLGWSTDIEYLDEGQAWDFHNN